MALLTIHADGSYEAVASQDTYASKINALKALIKSTKTGIKERTKKLEPLKRVAALKLRLQSVPPSQKESIRSKISAERQKHALSSKDTVLGTQKAITRLEGQITKHEGTIEKLTEKAAAAKERAKIRDAKTPVKPKVNIGGPGIGGAGAKIPRTPKSPVEKFAQGAKTAAGKMTTQVKVTLDRHEANLLKTAPKPAVKPTASTVKPTKVLTHKDDKNATAIKNTLTKIYALKKELANATPTKKPHMQADLAKLRGALRDLRKGATAEAKPKLAATVPAGKTPASALPSGVVRKLQVLRARLSVVNSSLKAGGARAGTTGKLQEEAKSLRAKIKALKEGTPQAPRVKAVKPVTPVATHTPKTRTKGTPAAERERLQKMLDKAKEQSAELRKRIKAAKGQGPLYGKLSIELQRLSAKIIRLEGKIKQK